MLEINSGSILIDGIDISTIPRHVLRERLTVIPQEPIFLRGSIRQNLDPLNLLPSDAEAQTILQKVGLWTLVADAGGLDVPMEAEELLSHGQRQLFCLARAIIRKSSVVIIDEATASVDLETDRMMQKIIEEEFEGCTVLAVAHRLEGIRGFDRVVVFEEGRVVESGEPGVLLGVEGGRFRGLWEVGDGERGGLDVAV